MHKRIVRLVHCTSGGIGRALIPDVCTGDLILEQARLLSIIRAAVRLDYGCAERILVHCVEGIRALAKRPVLLTQSNTIDRYDSLGIRRVAHLVGSGRQMVLLRDTCT